MRANRWYLKKRICNLLLQQELIQVNFFTIVSLTSSFDPERKIKLNKKKQCDRCFIVLLRLAHFFRPCLHGVGDPGLVG